MKNYLEIGRIVGTHAIKGEVRVQPWADSPDYLLGFKQLYFDEGREQLDILSARVHKNIVIMKIKGVDTVERADELRGRVLFMNRKDAHLPEGRYFVQDLLGCQVVDADTGRVYGVLFDVSNTVSSDIYHIKSSEGKEYLIPVLDEVRDHVDLEQSIIFIHSMRGMFDDED